MAEEAHQLPKMNTLSKHGCFSRRKWTDIRRLTALANDTGATFIMDGEKITIIPAQTDSLAQPAAGADEKENFLELDGQRTQAAPAQKSLKNASTKRQQHNRERAIAHQARLAAAAAVPVATALEPAALAEEPAVVEPAVEPAVAASAAEPVVESHVQSAVEPAVEPVVEPAALSSSPEPQTPATSDPWKDALEASFAKPNHSADCIADGSPRKKKGSAKKGRPRRRAL